MSETFTEFERDENAGTGVFFNHFITAVGIYVFTNEGTRDVSVADIAMAFNTTPDLAREAINEHPWLFLHDHDDPANAIVESDGE
jgi:hypothetical protein